MKVGKRKKTKKICSPTIQPHEKFKYIDEFRFKDKTFNIMSYCCNYVASVEENSIVLYDTKKKKLLGSYKHSGNVTNIFFNLDSRLIVSTENNNKIQLYDIKNKKYVFSYQHSCKIMFENLSPDNRYIAWGDIAGIVTVYDLENKQRVLSYSHEDAVASVYFRPDSKVVASGGWDNQVIVYDIANKKKLASYKHNRRFTGDSYVGSISFNKKGNLIVSGSKLGQIIIYDMFREKKRLLVPHSGDILSLFFLSNESYILSVGADKKVVMRNIKNLKSNVFGPFARVCVSPDNRFLVLGREEGDVIVHDLKAKKRVYTFNHGDCPFLLRFSRDHEKLWSMSQSNAKSHKTSCDFQYSNQVKMIKKKLCSPFEKNLNELRTTCKKQVFPDVSICNSHYEDFDISLDRNMGADDVVYGNPVQSIEANACPGIGNTTDLKRKRGRDKKREKPSKRRKTTKVSTETSTFW